MSNFDALTVNDGTGKRVTFENDNISTSPGKPIRNISKTTGMYNNVYISYIRIIPMT